MDYGDGCTHLVKLLKSSNHTLDMGEFYVHKTNPERVV